MCREFIASTMTLTMTDHDFHHIEVESELEFHLHRLIWFFLPFLPSLDRANNLLVM